MPMLSQNFVSLFGSQSAPFPEDVKEKIRDIVDQAHMNGQIIRFWNIPHDEAFWAELLECGVDTINADYYQRLRDFLMGANKTLY